MGSGEHQDLRSVLTQDGALTPRRAVTIVRQIAAALDDAHANQIAHRDITPATILVAGNDYAYLADLPTTTASVDTAALAYRAPELLANTDITYRADIYALACVLYECLTGVPPFPVIGEPAALIDAHLSGPVPYPSQEEVRLPTGFDAVIARGLARDPAQRYQHAGELAEAAEAALAGRAGPVEPAYAGLPTMPWQTPQQAPPAAPRRRRRRLVVAVTTVAMLGAVGAGAAVLVPKMTRSTAASTQPPAQHSYAGQPVELPFGGLVSPRRVAVDGAGNVYALDGNLGSRRLVKLAAGATEPTTVEVPDVEVTQVYDMTVDEAGDIYLIDLDSVWELAAGAPHPMRLPFGRLSNAHGLAVDHDGNVYTTADVPDKPGEPQNWDSHTGVLKLTPGDAHPSVLPFPDDLNLPKSVAVDATGSVYVIDSVKATPRILKLAAGAGAPVELPTDGVEHPESVAVGLAGALFVSETYGEVLQLVPGATSWISLPFRADGTTVVAVDTAGALYVAVDPLHRSSGNPPQIVKLAADS